MTIRNIILASLGVARIVNAEVQLVNSYHAEEYNNGAYGDMPAQSFMSSDVLAPRILVWSWKNRGLCSPESHIFLTLALGDGSQAPVILDAKDLSLVWTDPQWVGGIGLRPQEYNSKTYLTFYTSETADGWAGGEGVLLDDTYSVAHRVPTLDPGRNSDQHEFTLTQDGTALLTQTHTILTDCSVAGGPETGCQLVVGGFQEVDVASGQPLFTWNSTELAMPLNESCRPYGTTQRFGHGWDFFYINAVSKTCAGDYLVSGRNVCAVFLVSGKSGARIWQLGGAGNMFHDLSGGRATNFAGQHHVYFADEAETEVVMYDNHLVADEQHVDFETPGCRVQCSSARRIRLNYEKMTAELVSELRHPLGVRARAEGGVQVLSEGGALVSWGTVPAITEFLADGSVCLNVQVGPWSASASGANGLYRAYKFDYKATPYWDPAIAVVDRKVYVSWNGATEVRTWALIGGTMESQMVEMSTFEKRGFETEFVHDKRLPLMVRVEARDVDGNVLRSTRTVMTSPIL